MRTIILIVIAFAAVSLVVDALRKRKSPPADPSATSQRLMSANEAPPTETGKLRVREIVAAIKKHPDSERAEKAEKAASGAKPEEEKGDLPDPFDTNS